MGNRLYKIHEGTCNNTLFASEVGSKAFHLMQLVDLGYSDHILPGFALHTDSPDNPMLDDRITSAFEELLRFSGQLIVRSNHTQEGTGKYSFAGIFDSIEHVTTLPAFRDAITAIFQSAQSERVRDYCRLNELSDFDPHSMRYLVQPQITPDIFAQFHNATNYAREESGKEFLISFRVAQKEARLPYMHYTDSIPKRELLTSSFPRLLYYSSLIKEAQQIFGDDFPVLEQRIEKIARLARTIESLYPQETMEFELGTLSDTLYLFQRTPLAIHRTEPSNYEERKKAVKPSYTALLQGSLLYQDVVEEETVPLVVIDVPDATTNFCNPPEDELVRIRAYVDHLEQKIKSLPNCAVVLTDPGEYLLWEAKKEGEYTLFLFNRLAHRAKYVIVKPGTFALRHEQTTLLERGQRLIESKHGDIFSKVEGAFHSAKFNSMENRGNYATNRYHIERLKKDKPFEQSPEYIRIATIGDNVLMTPVL